MTREDRLKLAELLGLKKDEKFDSFIFQPLRSKANIYISTLGAPVGLEGTLKRGNYRFIDCRTDCLPSYLEAHIDALLLERADQILNRTIADHATVRSLIGREIKND